MTRHPLAVLGTAAILAGLLPFGASAQTVIIPDRGQVIPNGRGTAEELQLTDQEAARAFSASSGLTVGIVIPGPDLLPPDFDGQEIVGAIRATVERHGARVVLCDPSVRGAVTCVEEFVDDNAAGVIIVGSHGDLTDATARAVAKGLTVPIAIGDTIVAPGSVTIDSDPITRAYEQGKAGGAPKGVPRPKARGSAIIASAVEAGLADPASDAEALGLKETAPRVKIVARLGPPFIETTEDLALAVQQLPPSGILIGEGVTLTGATAEGLDDLPRNLRVVAVSCTPEVMALIDLGSRIRGCIARSNDGAGEAAGNAILGLLIGRDVPGFVDAPLYAYRGTVSVGPGSVQLGRRLPGANLLVSQAEKDAAAAVLGGRTVGIVSAARADAKEPAVTAEARLAMETALGAVGATVSLCSYGKNVARARACVANLVADGVAAIVVLGGSIDLTAAVSDALAAGVPVFGSDATYLGDTGAVYIDLDPRAVARLQGRMGATYAAATWPDNTAVYAAVLNATGPAGRDPVSDAVERAAQLSNPNLVPVGRYKTTPRSAVPGVTMALRQNPGLRLLLGSNAARGALDVRSIRKPRPPKDLVAFALTCSDALKDAIDGGGRVKGCVDVDPARAGTLLVDAMARLFAGGTLPGLVDVPIAPYPADAATPVATESEG